jgi:integrase
MAEKRALTVKRVETIKPPAKGQVDHWDAALPGFALRVSSKGAKSYVLLYRPRVGHDRGKLRRMTIGSAAEWSLAEARDEARDWKRRIDKGEDPKQVRADEHAVEIERAANSFGSVAGSYIERHAKRNQKSWERTAQYLNELVVPYWGDRPIDTIKRRDVIDLLDDIVDSGRPVTANRTLAHVRSLFNWAMDREIIETTPAVRIRPPGGKEQPRDRVLSDDEIRVLWPAFGLGGYPFGPMLKVLLLTGQRRSEAANMRWAAIDLEAGQWNIPGEMTKNGRPHTVPLAPAVVEILQSLPRYAGDYVFTTTGGERPTSGFSQGKARIEKLTVGEIPDWRLHDLRRTAASGMARLGKTSEHIGRVLNHTPTGVTNTRYNQHDYLPEKRHALEAWAAHVEDLFRPADEKVVVLRS